MPAKAQLSPDQIAELESRFAERLTEIVQSRNLTELTPYPIICKIGEDGVAHITYQGGTKGQGGGDGWIAPTESSRDFARLIHLVEGAGVAKNSKAVTPDSFHTIRNHGSAFVDVEALRVSLNALARDQGQNIDKPGASARDL